MVNNKNTDDFPDMSDLFGHVTQAMGEFSAPTRVNMVVADSADYDMDKLIMDRICGLLLEESLSVEEVALLAALLQGR